MRKEVAKPQGKRAAIPGNMPPTPVPSKKHSLASRVTTVVALVGVGLAVIFSLGILVGGHILASYDREHPDTMRCTVSSASPAYSRGGNWSVVIETPDCGKLGLSGRDINGTNFEKIAASLQSGKVYTVDIGEGTKSLLSVIQFSGITPTISGISLAPQ